MNNKSRKFRNIIMVIILVLITNIVTAGLVLSRNSEITERFSKLAKIKQILLDNYVDKIDKARSEKLDDAQIRGMVDSLGDPYTVYMDSKEFKAFNSQIAGSYAGVGIYIGEKDGKIAVVSPIEGSPAEKAGIRSGDFIVEVNGIKVSAKEMDKAVSMMLGKPGTTVKITLFRTGTGTYEKLITRAQITIKGVKFEMLKNKIGYLRISMFDENSADAFLQGIASLEKQGMKGLILDLRDNGGGLLDESAKIADRLLGKGTIVYTIDNKGRKDVWSSDEEKFDKPLVLLVNGGTASASEIVTGAIRDFKAGTIIGTKTFGKGIVQIPISLKDGSAVKVTIAKYYTPNGECIQKKGIIPNIILDLSKQTKEKLEKGKTITPSDDNQLSKGIEIIKSKL